MQICVYFFTEWKINNIPTYRYLLLDNIEAKEILLNWENSLIIFSHLLEWNLIFENQIKMKIRFCKLFSKPSAKTQLIINENFVQKRFREGEEGESERAE